MVQVKCSVDTTNFDRSFKRYMGVSRRSFAEILNKKAAIIGAGATKNTLRTDRGKIESELGKYVTVQDTTSKGGTRNRRTISLITRKGHSAPLAELIINKRRARKGEPGLQGADMDAAVKKMLGGRFRSIAFLASGWLPGIQTLANHLQDKSGIRPDRRAKWYGQPKGRAIAATPGFSPFAVIENTVSKGARPERIITAGLQKAIDAETRSMDEYVERQLSKDAKQF